MRAVIVEDNTTELEYLKRLLIDNRIKVIGEATNGTDGLRLIKNHRPDVAFLDVSMPGLSGVEIAKLISKNIMTVFVTGDHKYAIDAYNIGSIDYLLKPVTVDRVKETIGRLSKNFPQHDKKLILNIKGVLTLVDINKIYFLEKTPIIKKVTIYTEQSTYTVNGTLTEFQEKIKDYGFYRTHTSFIVNINKISQLIPWGDKSYILKIKGIKNEVPLSRKFATGLKSLLQINGC